MALVLLGFGLLPGKSRLERSVCRWLQSSKDGRRMPLADDIKAAKKMRLPWWGVLSGMAGCLPITLLLDHLGRFDLALPTLVSIGMLGVAMAIKWNLRRRLWFWITMTVIVALHVALILSVPWTTKWVPAIVIIPFGIADLYVMLWILSVVGKFLARPKTSEG
jgi:hypothetical protein